MLSENGPLEMLYGLHLPATAALCCAVLNMLGHACLQRFLKTMGFAATSVENMPEMLFFVAWMGTLCVADSARVCL